MNSLTQDNFPGSGIPHTGGSGHRDVRGDLLLALLPSIQPGNQRPISPPPGDGAAPGDLRRLLPLLPLLLRRRRGAQPLVPLPPHGRRPPILPPRLHPRPGHGGQGAGAAGGHGVRARERLHLHGGAGGGLRGGGRRAGAAAREHLLGRRALRGVPEVVQEDLCVAWEHAVYVCGRHGRAHGFLRPQEAALTTMLSLKLSL